MASPGADPERMLARLTVVSVALHGLLERLILSGTLDLADLGQIKQFAHELAIDLQAYGSTSAQVDGSLVAEEIDDFFGAMSYLRSDKNAPR